MFHCRLEAPQKITEVNDDELRNRAAKPLQKREIHLYRYHWLFFCDHEAYDTNEDDPVEKRDLKACDRSKNEIRTPVRLVTAPN
jgi:hypothetical protein